MRFVVFCLVAAVSVAACGDDGVGRVCSVNADCASLVCLPDGTCAPVTDAAMDSSTSPDGGVTDASVDVRGDATLSGCVSNGDGVIERGELPLMAGLRATFLVAQDVDVDTAGEDLGGGRRRWDLSGALDGDHTTLVETLEPSGWYAGDFPGASYVSRLSESTDLRQIVVRQ